MTISLLSAWSSFFFSMNESLYCLIYTLTINWLIYCKQINLHNKYSIMDNKYIFIIIIVILALCLLWYANSRSYPGSNSREYFTTQQTDLANKILTFFKSPNSYPTYVKFL